MLQHPENKYRPFPPIDLADRRWPSRTINEAPVWLTTDLRDGNQALFEPMNATRKLRLFEELVHLGFKEIEVGFPAASQTDFDVVRCLIDERRVPRDVTPMVMTQLREDLIEKTVRSVAGAQRVIIHLYNAIAPLWRRVVFGLSVAEVEQLVAHHVRFLREQVAQYPQTEWLLQYSPETFCMAELEVSLRICNTAIRCWDAGPSRPIIINLPTTVEVATPNVFADQVEWMNDRLERREHVVLSVHPHNDRGTGVACAEQALLAGAQRVEGCLFGNGERSGNLDLVTLALNLYTQGVHPRLDFSDIAAVARVVEQSTALPIHPRHPYVGDLVFTAFSGSHQDAIAKGFAAQAADALWAVPYLPIDPRDLGRTYDSIVRVNGQSGKGGIAFLLHRDHGVTMPRRMQIEFSAIVQQLADASEAELTSEEVGELFESTYLAPARAGGALAYSSHRLLEIEGQPGIEIELQLPDGTRHRLRGIGNTPVDAAVNALDMPLRIDSVENGSLEGGRQDRDDDGATLAVVEGSWHGVAGSHFGAGRHPDMITASVQAVLSLAARFSRTTE
ncbi:2-isopropylmalate synthase [Halomonas huangheensis]|uniref:2-isopropylmalate synthase n=1 Tax=Halomonas huangheensis TaxID=1178482 RepID=W1NBY4_9GAMM|nr:2-isopropylmalate synthase [Halomonas huangheensis]ALM54765.1 2-isopropylmalate synthase [Halomonas huangheensis]ERL52420.1 2-isopropylmalate synthase [Halomonas huangheensis]